VLLESSLEAYTTDRWLFLEVESVKRLLTSRSFALSSLQLLTWASTAERWHKLYLQV
jgi:hypothetical protein